MFKRNPFNQFIKDFKVNFPKLFKKGMRASIQDTKKSLIITFKANKDLFKTKGDFEHNVISGLRKLIKELKHDRKINMELDRAYLNSYYTMDVYFKLKK